MKRFPQALPLLLPRLVFSSMSGPMRGFAGVALVALAALAADAVGALAAGGWLVVEIGPVVAAAAERALAAVPGLVPGPTLADMAGLPRIVQARKA